MPRRKRGLTRIRGQINVPEPLQAIFDHFIACSDAHNFDCWTTKVEHGRTSPMYPPLDQAVIDHDICDFEDLGVDVFDTIFRPCGKEISTIIITFVLLGDRPVPEMFAELPITGISSAKVSLISSSCRSPAPINIAIVSPFVAASKVPASIFLITALSLSNFATTPNVSPSVFTNVWTMSACTGSMMWTCSCSS